MAAGGQYYVQGDGAGNSGYDPNAAMGGDNQNEELQFQWKIDLNFDPKTDTIILKVKELLSKRAWSKTMGKQDVNGKIRDEYNRLGKAIANGVCDYVYPKDSGAVTVTIKFQNDQFHFSVPQDYS
mmetsp:Transcript_24203/g.21162  ORF Transcript_24203/g.21162 Transcript_24203/m.21162 type:complete len:125 (+) Transcript_24203:77-451(+)|eukprot:CAMPEP_0201572826 /NCGR_PEP_ID=MMETSP0190_2-20130828/16335_1 /ASSEMBLY_ACC=CAM_ASM_000263 /TAXON_ID=37353 /ORGANISM="Rosalina sp." /LENGTH=124 /DNA_ID=CAMNT_0047999087 /DNA_START=76 /DNA_END=450 /DNA_ORIENTATION=-